jgi:hypothetical protein
MAMGGWASAVYLQYIRPSVQIYAAAQAALANSGFVSASSIRAMHPLRPVCPSYDRDLTHKPVVADVFTPLVFFNGVMDL